MVIDRAGVIARGPEWEELDEWELAAWGRGGCELELELELGGVGTDDGGPKSKPVWRVRRVLMIGACPGCELDCIGMFSLSRWAGGGGGGGGPGGGSGGDVGDCRSVARPVPVLSRRRRRRGGSGSGSTGSGAVDVWRVARRALVTGEPEANGAAVAAPTPPAAAAASEELVPELVPPRCRFRLREAILWMRGAEGRRIPLCRRG